MTEQIDIPFLSAIDLLSKKTQNQLDFDDIALALDQRIKQKNPDINAFDSRVDKLELGSAGPLNGLPISVKDQILVAGMPCNFGLDKAAKKPCTSTAKPIQRLLDAGVSIIGKTNLPPYAMDFQTFNKRAGLSSNPWNKDYTTGGSSGGGAAAVAAGMSYLDIGADLAGSLRIPAAFCGVFSLLPSEGALETGDMMAEDTSLSHFGRMGPIARTVDDLALAWQTLSGKERKSKSTSDIKLAFWEPSAIDFVDDRIQGVFQQAKTLFLTAGIELQVTHAEYLLNQKSYETYGEIMGFETGSLIPSIPRILGRILGRSAAKRSPNFLKNVQSGQALNHKRYQRALEQRLKIQHQFETQLANFDALLLPVTRINSFKHIVPASDRNGIRDYQQCFNINDQSISYLDAITAYTTPVTLVGNPVITLPLGLDKLGLPVGAQLVGKMNGEWQLLELAKQLSILLPRVSLATTS